MTDLPSPMGIGGKAPEVLDVQVVALYDPETGNIAHVHNVTVYKGGRTVSEKEAIDTALARAYAVGHKTERFKIKVSKNAEHGRSPHRIDLLTGDFIAMASPLQKRQLR